MAQNAKKTTTKKPAAKKAPAKKPAAKKSEKKGAKPQTDPSQVTQRRVLAVVLLVLSFLGFLSMFHAGGFLIDWYHSGFTFLLGYGVDALPLALLFAGLLLLFRAKKRIRIRVICWTIIPMLFGAVRHLLATPAGYWDSLTNVLQLGRDGMALQSGGLLAGGLAELARMAISPVGAAIVFVLLLVICFLAACHVTPALIMGWVRRARPLPEPPPEPKPEPEVRETRPVRREAVPLTASKKVDIPLDDDSYAPVRPEKPAAEETELPPPTVPTPAETVRRLFRRDKPAEAAAPEAKTEEPFVPFEPIGPKDMPPAPPAPEAEPVLQDAADTPPWEDDPDDEEEAAAAKRTAVPEEDEEEEESVEQQLERARTEGDKPLYLYPPLRLLKPGPGKPAGSAEAIRRCAERLVDTLRSFGVNAEVINTTDGPAVTRYELVLERGIKLSKVSNLSDDIALALGASGIRVSAIPDKNAVGIEVPNEQQELVTARDIIASPAFQNARSRLAFAIGKDITGQPVVGDIAKMPHMLIAGTTGSGKSVCINSILMSILYKATPEEVRLIMVDPKMIELGVYNGVPHLLIPVVTDPKKAAGALNWAVTEMMRRYTLFSQIGARNLSAYNAEIAKDPDNENERLPQVVIVIDELADLMAVARSDVENSVIRLAQMARAAGMHLIIATQRPSADVITGLMKDNIPSRIAFAVASAINSRIILDQSGAEKLLGKGDMLYLPLGMPKPQRVQGCFVSDGEVEEVVSFVKQCGQAEYNQEILDHIEKQAQKDEKDEGGGASGLAAAGEEDELFDEAVEVVVSSGQASVSMLQRRLKLGYSRAARLVDQMEDRGIVGPFEGSKARAVLITKSDWAERMERKREC